MYTFLKKAIFMNSLEELKYIGILEDSSRNVNFYILKMILKKNIYFKTFFIDYR